MMKQTNKTSKTSKMSKIRAELRTWNWEAIGAFLFCWAVVFYPFIK